MNAPVFQRESTALTLLRMHQWSKNLLVFVPLVASHQVAQSLMSAKAALAFVSLSAIASSGYIINDILDVDADRLHKHKKHRAIAAGKISMASAVRLLIAFGLVGLGLSAVAGITPLVSLLFYLTLSFSYSRWLKRFPLVDIVFLALLYLYRILVGSVFCNIVPTDWLLVFGFFLFFSLATAKRVVELQDLEPDVGSLKNRGYDVGDLPFLRVVGPGSGMIATILLALYLKSDHVALLYYRPDFLWGCVLSCFLWTTHLWFAAFRSQLHHDPVWFAIKDPVSAILGILALASVFGAGPK